MASEGVRAIDGVEMALATLGVRGISSRHLRAWVAVAKTQQRADLARAIRRELRRRGETGRESLIDQKELTIG